MADRFTGIDASSNRTLPASFTPVTSADTPANLTTTLAKWWREDNYLYLDFHFQFTGALGAAVVFTLDLPVIDGVQVSMDATELGGSFGATNATRSHFGIGTWYLSGTGWIVCEVVNADAVAGVCTKIQFAYSAQHILESQLTTGGALRACGIRVPILGWK